jgi:hypothetical protein
MTRTCGLPLRLSRFDCRGSLRSTLREEARHFLEKEAAELVRQDDDSYVTEIQFPVARKP